MYLNPMLLADFYKISHRLAYPDGMEICYSTWTPRASRIKGIDHVVAFGFQGFIKHYLFEVFNQLFFDQSLESVLRDYRRIVTNTLGDPNPDTSHIEALHNLGYLPLEIKAVAEGTLVPIRCPMLTIQNTDSRFFWLTNYIETLASCELWGPSTSATIALQYKKLLTKYAMNTAGDASFVPFQGHDFSMRGMGSLGSALTSGAGHLTSFVGTDTIPAIQYLEFAYKADVEKELIGCSVPATEHSVECANGMDEYSTIKRLITEVYPKGIVSRVSDTWDFWHVLTDDLPRLKNEIMARDGKLVIRPDSGDPVKIVCGDVDGKTEAERKGAIELLWDTFGGTITPMGYKQLDPHIGLIYGDAITLERCESICAGLQAKGFASTNMVFGIGSYTYQYNTRDTFGFALKSTLCQINGDQKMIYKAPKTDDGTKISQKGRVVVLKEEGKVRFIDGLFLDEQVEGDLLQTVFKDGVLHVDQSLSEIRARIAGA
jgi:nicotinamide phosphoribosyltransferase